MVSCIASTARAAASSLPSIPKPGLEVGWILDALRWRRIIPYHYLYLRTKHTTRFTIVTRFTRVPIKAS